MTTELVFQLMMGLSLAACTGLRTWLPLFAVGIAARTGFIPLNSSYDFLVNDGVLITFAVATVLELLGDKVLSIDHFLDAAGTFVRPIAGTVLAASLFSQMDPGTATILGLVAGGGTALTVHTGKAVTRAKVSAFSPLHLGAGNFMVSLAEDFVSAVGVVLALLTPILAALFTILLVAGSIIAIVLAYRAGRKIYAQFRSRSEAGSNATQSPTGT